MSSPTDMPPGPVPPEQDELARDPITEVLCLDLIATVPLGMLVFTASISIVEHRREYFPFRDKLVLVGYFSRNLRISPVHEPPARQGLPAHARQYLSNTVEYLTSPQEQDGISNALIIDVKF